jgi:poly-D-alanine transfer protein DltD
MHAFISLLITIALFLGGCFWFGYQQPFITSIAARARSGPLHHFTNRNAKNIVYLNTYGFNRPLFIGSSDLFYNPETRDPYHCKPIFENYATPNTPLLLGYGGAQNYFSFTILALGLADAGNPVIILVSPHHFGAAASIPMEGEIDRWDGTITSRFSRHINKNILETAFLKITNREIKYKYAVQTLPLIEEYRHTFGTCYAYIKSIETHSALTTNAIEPLIQVDAAFSRLFDRVRWAIEYAREKTPSLHRDISNLKPLPARSLKQERSKEVTRIAESVITDNEYGVYNQYWDRYVKEKYISLTKNGIIKNSRGLYILNTSREWADYELLCEFVKEKNLNVHFIITAVNRKFYESLGFDFSNINAIYERIEEVAARNNINYTSYGLKSSENYWLSDIMHMGWLSNIETLEVMRDHFSLEEH